MRHLRRWLFRKRPAEQDQGRERLIRAAARYGVRMPERPTDRDFTLVYIAVLRAQGLRI